MHGRYAAATTNASSQPQFTLHRQCAVPESSGVWTFVVSVELGVQSQQRRTTVHDTHSCSQQCLVLEQVGLELALE